MLLESDTLYDCYKCPWLMTYPYRWKSSIEDELRKVKDAIQKLATHVSLPEVTQSLHEEGLSTAQDEEPQRITQSSSVPTSWELVVDTSSGPEAIPASYLSQPAPATQQRHEDMITRGKISIDNAQTYLNLYRTKLDHFPYRIFVDQRECTLNSIRTGSPFLLAAICAVSSLHMAEDDFNSCIEEFRAMHSHRSLAKDIGLDDIRALCIGAFWLSDCSWALIGTAVRMATELQLHRSFAKALQGDREHYLRARLYLLVYACDHHFSIPYGRPPLTREDDSIRNVRKFLHCADASEDDARLVSQVLRWSLCTNVFDTYGTDTDTLLTEPAVSQLRMFCVSLDSLRAEWCDRFSINPHVGNYPSKGVSLQCDFAKLYICSHAFRGLGVSRTVQRSQETTLIVDNIAHDGILSALAIINTVASDEEVQSFFDGLPIYFDIMLAFSVVFLFKISRISPPFRLDVEATKRSVHGLVVALKPITARIHSRHLLVDLAKGMEGLLQKWGPIEDNRRANDEDISAIGLEECTAGANVTAESSWYDGLLDPRFMGEYDILMGQEMDFEI